MASTRTAFNARYDNNGSSSSSGGECDVFPVTSECTQHATRDASSRCDGAALLPVLGRRWRLWRLPRHHHHDYSYDGRGVTGRAE